MTSRLAPALLTAAAAGVLAGSGLAALAHAPRNDACSDFGSLAEGSSSGGSLELWPLGLRCDYYGAAGRLARSEFLGPPAGELYAWIALATVLAAAALLARRSAPARGAACAAEVLALSGALWHFAGFNLAVIGGAMFFGPPLVLALDHALRPAGTRSPARSLLVALTLPAAACVTCVVFVFLGLEPAGVAAGLLAGALAATVLARLHPRPVDRLLSQ